MVPPSTRPVHLIRRFQPPPLILSFSTTESSPITCHSGGRLGAHAGLPPALLIRHWLVGDAPLEAALKGTCLSFPPPAPGLQKILKIAPAHPGAAEEKADRSPPRAPRRVGAPIRPPRAELGERDEMNLNFTSPAVAPRPTSFFIEDILLHKPKPMRDGGPEAFHGALASRVPLLDYGYPLMPPPAILAPHPHHPLHKPDHHHHPYFLTTSGKRLFFPGSVGQCGSPMGGLFRLRVWGEAEAGVPWQPTRVRARQPRQPAGVTDPFGGIKPRRE